MKSNDQATAQAFASSWNNLPSGSIYTRSQFEDWMAPLTRADIEGRNVLELGCGNASLLVHCCDWQPTQLVGIDLGASVETARLNVASFQCAQISQDDLVGFKSDRFDVVYCIGVLHHLKDPFSGFMSVLRNTLPGGRFHCWVYAREGNAVVIGLVEPIRKIASRLPWWITKYLVATPLAVPYYLYAKLLHALCRLFPRAAPKFLAWVPLRDYSLWIAKRGFLFFRHVAFDQLVTPQTTYISRAEIKEWIRQSPEVEQGSSYIICRNGNSWKFGGRKLQSGGAHESV